MNNIQVGQVLYLKIRFNNIGDISTTVHPYVVFKIDVQNNILEVIQLDSIKPKNMKMLLHYKAKSGVSPTYIVRFDNPKETVISKDSFAQLDNKFLLQNFAGLEKFLKNSNKLSSIKLKKLFEKYEEYHKKEFIDENKQVYISMEEILKLNH